MRFRYLRRLADERGGRHTGSPCSRDTDALCAVPSPRCSRNRYGMWRTIPYQAAAVRSLAWTPVRQPLRREAFTRIRPQVLELTAIG
jgi:hypothetical protein